jgi:hypothetical protein
MANNWKDTVFPHKYECNKARRSDAALVGKTPRQQMHEAVTIIGRDIAPQLERLIEEAYYQDSFAVTHLSVEDVYNDREADWKKNRIKATRKRMAKRIMGVFRFSSSSRHIVGSRGNEEMSFTLCACCVERSRAIRSSRGITCILL